MLKDMYSLEEFYMAIKEVRQILMSEDIYLYLKDNEDEIKQQLLLCKNDTEHTKYCNTIIQCAVKKNLLKEEYDFGRKIIIAYFRKSQERKKINIDNNEIICSCCKKSDKKIYEFDHIIQFKIVGDELENNLQILCKDCHKEKRKNIFYKIQKMIW